MSRNKVQKPVVYGTALSASTLTRTSGITSYPVAVDFTRPIDWVDGDQAVMQWSTDYTFATGVSEGSVQTLYAATTSYNFGLSAITSGSYFMRMGAWRGVRPLALNWSNIINVGDNLAPTISTTTSFSGYQYLPGTFTITASEPIATWTVSGPANFSIVSATPTTATLSWTYFANTGTQSVSVTAIDYAGNESAAWNGTLTLGANIPPAYTYTDVTNATLGGTYTSNVITIGSTGTQPGTSWPWTLTSFGGSGTVYKNGVSAGTSGTAVAGDQFYIVGPAPSSNNSSFVYTFALASLSESYLVSTPVVLSTTTIWGSDRSSGTTVSGADNLTISGSGGAYVYRNARASVPKSTGKRYLEFTIGSNFGGQDGVGFANASALLDGTPGNPTDHYIGGDDNGAAYYASGAFDYRWAWALSFSSFTTGDIISFAIDIDNSLLWIAKNGVWLNNGNPNTLTNGIGISVIGTTVYPAFSTQNSATATLNTGHTTFAYPVPLNFYSWDV